FFPRWFVSLASMFLILMSGVSTVNLLCNLAWAFPGIVNCPRLRQKLRQSWLPVAHLIPSVESPSLLGPSYRRRADRHQEPLPVCNKPTVSEPDRNNWCRRRSTLTRDKDNE